MKLEEYYSIRDREVILVDTDSKEILRRYPPEAVPMINRDWAILLRVEAAENAGDTRLWC